MKKSIGVISATITLLLSVSPAFAQLITCPGQFAALCNLSSQDSASLIGQLINFAFILAILVALGFLIYGGVKWITSGGEKTDVEGARNHVIAAVVGLVIVFLSYFVINLVTQFFTGKGLGDPGFVIPKLTPVCPTGGAPPTPGC